MVRTVLQGKHMINLTESARDKLSALCTENNVDAVRLAVKGGGCSGFQYQWDLIKADELSNDDFTIDLPIGKFTVDNMSLLYIAGTTVDYVTELFGSSFQIKNPNSKASCGCGESFSV